MNYNVEEGIQRLREIGILEWICHLMFTHPPREGPEDISVTTDERNKVVRGAPAPLKGSVIALLRRPGLTVGVEVTELGNLYVFTALLPLHPT